MTKSGFIVVSLAAMLSGPAFAQASLSDQIGAVSAAQDSERARQDAIAWAAARQVAYGAAQQRAAQDAAERRRIAVWEAAEQRRAAARQQAQDEATADKKRDQDYEEQLRALHVEHRKTQLTSEKETLTIDKKREQAYEDQLRALQLQQQAIELKRLQTRVARENDVIDHELKNQTAKTDVIQSGADATRSVADGANSFLRDTGKAAIKREERVGNGVGLTVIQRE
jgi:hypothetical protein